MPPRISASFQKKKKSNLDYPHTIQITLKKDLQMVTKEASTSRPQKKQKTSSTDASPNADLAQPVHHAKFKGRKPVKLVFMQEMPMDILFEAFVHLEPADLLHLSRASKDLRNILIASNAIFLWKLVYLFTPLFYFFSQHSASGLSEFILSSTPFLQRST